MKKTAKYMSDEDFSELQESLTQALQHARGERNDLRVTVLPKPQHAPQATASLSAIKEAITQELEGLSDASLRQLIHYVAFLKFQEHFKTGAAEDPPTAQAMVG
jgi:DNA-binding MurR/RpiR family transcriptional regulator